MTAVYLRQWCKENGYNHRELTDEEIVFLRAKKRKRGGKE